MSFVSIVSHFCRSELPTFKKIATAVLYGLTGLVMHTAKRQNAEGLSLTVKATGLFLLGISERDEK
jgi:surface polysaccharide O-acyltransferase-like enzyme